MADAVVDQITEVFVEPSAAVNHLVQAAAGSPTTSPGVSGPPSSPRYSHFSPQSSPSSSLTHTSDQESDAQLTRRVELFRRDSRRLSQVASHAAQSSADSKRKYTTTIQSIGKGLWLKDGGRGVDQMVLCAFSRNK